MKDAKHHLKQLQKKVVKSTRKDESNQNASEKITVFKRPKTVLNRRKFA